MKATTSPSWNTGTVLQRSGKWPMLPSVRYVSFIRKTSPGRMVSGGKSRTTAFGMAE